MNKVVVGTIVAALILVGGYAVLSRSGSKTILPSQPDSSESSASFSNPKKAAHYESNTPAHGETLAGVPINVVIDFNFDLAIPSAISITSQGKEYGVGETIIDDNQLTLRRSMDPSAPDGLYTVSYKACWPDQSCHDGHFQFRIDRSVAESFEDMRNQAEVTVDMSTFLFKPRNIRISPGTKVTWTNSDPIDHYINTDSHPAHTYYVPQNSRAISKGQTYSVTYTNPGIYPYHCSAHFHTMKGSILVG